MRKTTKPKSRLIGTMEVAALLHCHPMSVARYTKEKKGFPKPTKLFGQNLWDEATVEAYLAKMMKT